MNERPPLERRSGAATRAASPSPTVLAERRARRGAPMLRARRARDDGGRRQDAPTDAAGDGFLEELMLPSLVQRAGAAGPGHRARPGRAAAGRRAPRDARAGQPVRRHLAPGRRPGDRGRAARRPADHAGLLREAEILSSVQYAMLPRCYLPGRATTGGISPSSGWTARRWSRRSRPACPSSGRSRSSSSLSRSCGGCTRPGWALLGLTPADVSLGQPLRLAHLGQAGRIGEPPPQALQVAGYSAPELAYRETVTGKEDVYTLGAILYHALAGRPPSDGELDAADLADSVRLPGGPQLLADALAPADERLDLEALYRAAARAQGPPRRDVAEPRSRQRDDPGPEPDPPGERGLVLLRRLVADGRGRRQRDGAAVRRGRHGRDGGRRGRQPDRRAQS